MYKTLIAGAVTLGMIAPAVFAEQPATLDLVMRELQALSQRVDKLEHDNAALVSENAQLKQAAAATSTEVAAQAPRVASLEKGAAASEWASRIAWKGDFRYRHEQVEPEESSVEQKRERIRARFGLTAKLNDKLSTTVAIGTNGGSSDPRSMNQTLGDGLNRKGIGLDLAYADWKPATGVTVLLGKTPYPWTRVASHLWDPDLTWEGGSVKFERGAFFGTAMGSWLSESTSVHDGTLFGAQFGLKGDVGGVKLLGALNYFDVGALQGQVTTAGGGFSNGTVFVPCPLNNSAFFGGPQGNSTIVGPDGCVRLANDFNLVELIAQADLKLGHFPFVVFVDLLQNQDPSDLNNAFAVGFTLGKAADPHSWELGYLYQDVEKDAQFGQFMESDFGGGLTDSNGSVFKFGYAVAKGWTANATYFLNDRFVDVGDTHRYDRFQLDLGYKF